MTVLEIKALVRERDGFACVVCGMSNADHIAATGRQLDVHRLVPRSDYAVEACIAVCRPCHGKLPKSPRGTGNGDFVLRLPDRRLLAAITEHARQTRRSRNLAIVILLEEAMQAAGLWPPPPAPPS